MLRHRKLDDHAVRHIASFMPLDQKPSQLPHVIQLFRVRLLAMAKMKTLFAHPPSSISSVQQAVEVSQAKNDIHQLPPVIQPIRELP